MSHTPYYEAAGITLYLGDCIEIMRDMEPATIATVLADPPYSSGGRRESARTVRQSMTRAWEDKDWIRGDAMSTNGFMHLMRLAGMEWRRILIPGGHALTFIDWRMAFTLLAALETADLRQHPILVWDKMNIGMGAVFRNQHEFITHVSAGNPNPPQRRDVPNVLRFAAVRGGEHPTEKPEPLLRTLLSVVNPRDGVVLDPFAGSGSNTLCREVTGVRGGRHRGKRTIL